MERREVRPAYDGFGRVTSVERATTPAGGTMQRESRETYHYDVAAAGGPQPAMAPEVVRGQLSWIESDGTGTGLVLERRLERSDVGASGGR